MPTERTPMLPTAARARRRAAYVVVAIVSLVIAFVLTMRVTGHLTKPTATKTGDGVSPSVAFPADANGNRHVLQYCEKKHFTQDLNHFQGGGNGTYQQRYFVCGRQFFNADNGTIFFYLGNEGDVMLFLNNTGLMWENAQEFNALLVFAEHRYFGESIPFGEEVLDHMEHLSSTQALADYAVLIRHIKDELHADVPVIGFGGSYGGMLGTWFRLKYPHLMDGVIAASAPVLVSVNDPDSPLDSEGFLRVTTFDMSENAGSSPRCVLNARKAIDTILRLEKTAEGRDMIAEELAVCDPASFTSSAEVDGLVGAISGMLSGIAQSNYPYPSSYATDGMVNLPAYPMRVACEHLAPDFGDEDRRLLSAMLQAVGVSFNATGDRQCFYSSHSTTVNDTRRTLADVGNLWSYIQCSEIYLPSSSDGVHDFLPPQPAHGEEQEAGCESMWGIRMRPDWALTEYGGLKALRSTSNIVFSNGNYDPWSALGVRVNLSESVVAVHIEGGAHHADLFFTNALDPPSLTQAREVEKRFMHQWVHAFYERKQQRRSASVDTQWPS